MSLINKGKKFIPCFHLNSFHFFKNLLNNFELNISSLNKSFFCSKFYKKSYKLNLIENIDKSTDLSLIDSFELVNLNNIKHDIKKIIRRVLIKFWASNFLSGKIRLFYNHVFSIINYLKEKSSDRDFHSLIRFERTFIRKCNDYKLNIDYTRSKRFNNNLKPRHLHYFLNNCINRLNDF